MEDIFTNLTHLQNPRLHYHSASYISGSLSLYVHSDNVIADTGSCKLHKIAEDILRGS